MTASEVPTPEVIIIAAALAEAHREGARAGWNDAARALRDCGLINAADWLDVNRPE